MKRCSSSSQFETGIFPRDNAPVAPHPLFPPATDATNMLETFEKLSRAEKMSSKMERSWRSSGTKGDKRILTGWFQRCRPSCSSRRSVWNRSIRSETMKRASRDVRTRWSSSGKWLKNRNFFGGQQRESRRFADFDTRRRVGISSINLKRVSIPKIWL